MESARQKSRSHQVLEWTSTTSQWRRLVKSSFRRAAGRPFYPAGYTGGSVGKSSGKYWNSFRFLRTVSNCFLGTKKCRICLRDIKTQENIQSIGKRGKTCKPVLSVGKYAIWCQARENMQAGTKATKRKKISWLVPSAGKRRCEQCPGESFLTRLRSFFIRLGLPSTLIRTKTLRKRRFSRLVVKVEVWNGRFIV